MKIILILLAVLLMTGLKLSAAVRDHNTESTIEFQNFTSNPFG